MNNERLPSIFTYITIVGFIVALVLNFNKSGEDKRFNAFHLRQSVGLFIVFAGINIILKALFLVQLMGIINITYFVIVILQIVGAANNEYKLLPFVGDKVEKILGRSFE